MNNMISAIVTTKYTRSECNNTFNNYLAVITVFSIGHELTYGFKIKACQKLFVKAINSKINGITYIFWIKTKKIRSLKMYSHSY